MSNVREVGSIAYVLPCEEPDWDIESDPRKVVKWSKTAKELKGGQLSKCYKLVSYDCIQYAGDNEFVSLPLDTHTEVFFKGKQYKKKPFSVNFNRDPTPYVLTREGELFSCSCQWNQKMHKPCSHIMALIVEFKRKKFRRWFKHE